MVFCQKCGAENAENARFCNMCGAKIADPGEPGGPIEPAAQEGPAKTLVGHNEPRASVPPPSASDRPSSKEKRGEAISAPVDDEPPEGAHNAWQQHDDPAPQSLDVSTMSLSAIGVRSKTSAWGTLIFVALLLIGLGAGLAYVAMNAEDEASEPVATTDEVEPEAPVEVVEEVPEGAEPPEDVVMGTPEPTARRRGTRGTSRRGSSQSSGEGAAQGSGSGSGGSGSSGSGSSGSGSSGSGSGSGSSGSGSSGSGSGSSGSGSSGSGSGSGSSGSGSGGSGSGSSGSDSREWEEMESPRDLQMDLYAGRVRRFISQYYMGRASSCFSHASRNAESVRGTVQVAFEIQADGRVRNARVARNTTGVESLGGCLSGQVGNWRLPAPPDGEAPLAMQMPFSR